MRHQLRLWASAAFVIVLLSTHHFAAAQSSSSFTYQGYLTNAGSPVTAICAFQFSLFNASSAGSQIGSTLTRTGVSVAQGVFSVQLDFGEASFNGVPRYLDIAVKCGADVSYTVLTPRPALAVAPYALTAFNAPNHWALTGNAATNPSTQFIGTTDNQPFEVRVNNVRALRIEPKAHLILGTAPNVIEGSPANGVSPDAVGATISGGGSTSDSTDRNLVIGNFGTIGGGLANTVNYDYSTVGGGESNTASNTHSTVGGGESNTASGDRSTVGGGESNTASNIHSTVGGGESNTASNTHSTVGGGESNTASGDHSTVGGGYANIASGSSSTVVGGGFNTASGSSSTVGGGSLNTASGSLSYAAGKRAKADDSGAFVWADSQDADVFSPGVNTFTVRAAGGIWLGTTSSPYLFANRFIETSTGAYLSTGGLWVNASDRALKTNFTQIDPRAILDAVAAMPITAWNYTIEGDSIKHVGPTAQDFRAAFGLGQDDKSISTVDAAGVALAAIQGLKAENDALKGRVGLLEVAAGNSLVLPALIVAFGILGAALILRRR